MTQEEKQLLLKDLCARLRYGVKFTLSDNIYTMKGIDLIVTDEGDWEYAVTAKGIEPIEIEYIKPYLRSMSSMTEGERNEYFDFRNQELQRVAFAEVGRESAIAEISDWLNEHYFDYRGLIEKGLALEAPEGMYKTE